MVSSAGIRDNENNQNEIATRHKGNCQPINTESLTQSDNGTELICDGEGGSIEKVALQPMAKNEEIEEREEGPQSSGQWKIKECAANEN